MNTTTKIALVADSQGRGLQDLLPEVSLFFRGGARVRDLLSLTRDVDLSPFQFLAIWIGGNDAHPRQGCFDPVDIRKHIVAYLHYIRSNYPELTVFLVSATRRASPAPHDNIPHLNLLLEKIAAEHSVHFLNPHRRLDKIKGDTYSLLKKDGVHLKYSAKLIVLQAVRNFAKYGIKRPTRKPDAEPGWARKLKEPTHSVSGRNSVLSNFHHTRLSYNGIWYPTAEHAYQYQKCIAYGFYREANRILTTSDPGWAKSIGKAPNHLISNEDKVRILTPILWARWHQQPNFRDVLTKTKGMRITHDVPDEFWGHVNGLGLDTFGKLLMSLRLQSLGY